MSRSDPKEAKEYNARRYQEKRRGSFWGRLTDIFYAAKARSKRKNIEFTITTETFNEQTHCLIFKQEKFDFFAKGSSNPNSMSIDRIDPTKGYTPDNVWLICERANRIKSDATPEELKLIAEAVAERLKRNAKGE